MPDPAPRAPAQRERRWPRRIGWLVVIWAASVAAVALVAYALRAAMAWAGLVR